MSPRDAVYEDGFRAALNDQPAKPPPHLSNEDPKLWATLPAKSDPYDYHRLSEAETIALIVALGDGFGSTLLDYRAMPLPAGIKSGLLQHHFFVEANSEYDPEWNRGAFWESPGGDKRDRPPSDIFPLKFDERRLCLYFQNQFARFCARSRRDDPSLRERDSDKRFAISALNRFYQKPWYEIHALQFLICLVSPKLEYGVAQSIFAGRLGRLVEQYY
jgi:hypothetical protein